MKFEKKTRSLDGEAAPNRKIKKLDVQLDIRNSNLVHEIKQAFDLAKSSGHELDLTFSHGAV
jgi:hypothetical protein